MISRQLSRAEHVDETGLKGTELTAWIRQSMEAVDLIRKLVFTEPARSRRRELRYNLVAKTGSLFSDGAA